MYFNARIKQMIFKLRVSILLQTGNLQLVITLGNSVINPVE